MTLPLWVSFAFPILQVFLGVLVAWFLLSLLPLCIYKFFSSFYLLLVLVLRLAVERAVEGVSHANGFACTKSKGNRHLDLLSLGNIG
jgi:hypothetical protein